MTAKKGIAKIDKPVIKSTNLFPVVGIGASAGGLDAFKKLLKAIPEDSGMAYVLIQHLEPSHQSLLPEILQKVTKIPVLEITDEIKVHPDHIYVIPSNKIMVATDGVLLLAPRPEKSKTERNLPIDRFFNSLAEVHQEHAIGVVLSGTASDGTQGLKAIKEQGGITFAQDEASAEYDGMPHSAAQAGVVDFILPPGEIPKKLLEVAGKIKVSDAELQNILKQKEDVFKQILSLLRIRKGVDFTYYKQTTIRRRILRRMLVNKNEEPGDYLKFLRGNNQEQDLLYQDMLIPVTSFFRDKKVFQDLCNNVFPAILKNKVPGEITRVWVAGCSTGQEVYSFAVCFKEFLGDHHERIQIFGTDLSEPAITKARTGIYEKSELDAVSPERLKEYFTKNNGGYQVNKSIRNMCVFAHHNFLKDPPFGKMDCISCRNVLIYMEPYLQKKALTTFHYALNPKGFLLLGKSETTGGVPDLFAAVEKADKLYTRKNVPGRFMQVASQRSEQIFNHPPDSFKTDPDRSGRTDFQKTADDILLTKYTPAGVVVNEAMDMVHFRGNTANYLEQAPGKPSHNLLMMAKNGLGFELRNILHKAKAEKVPVIKENIPLSVNGSLRNISIEAMPLPNTLEPYCLVLFHDNNVTDTDGLVTTKKVSTKTKKDEKDIQIKLLEQELAQAREDMRSITEDQEASNEELQSANEELLSGSEELQSLNEELETSKEELQSTNEELTVLNHELVGLNEQVTDARNYSESIVATLYQPLLVLDKHLRVKTANKAFYKTFNVNEKETEGVLIYDLGNRQWNIPELRILLEEILPQKKQISNFEVRHNFTSIGERIILLSGLELTREKKEEKLILLSIEDVTERTLAQNRIKESEHRFHELVRSSPSLISILKGEDMIIEIANDAMLESWGKGNIIGQSVFKAVPESVEQGFDKLLLGVYKTGEPVKAYEVPVTLLRNGTKELVYYNFIYQAQHNAKGEIEGVATIATEVTPQAEFNLKIKASEEQFRSLVMQAPVAICIFKGSDFVVEVANKHFLNLVDKTENELVGKPVFDSLPETRAIVEPLLLGVLKTGVPYFGNELENNINRFGKNDRGFFNFVYEPVFGDDGTTNGIIVVVTEVTEQVLARKKIEESEAKFSALANNIPNLAWMANADGWIYWYNNRWYEYIGKTPAEMEGWGWKSVHDPEQLPFVLERWQQSINNGASFEMTFPLLGADGTFRTFLTRVEPMLNNEGKVLRWIGTNTDITDQLEAYKKIQVSEAFNRTILESSPDCIKMLDAEGRLEFMNNNGMCLLEIDDFKQVENTFWWDMWEPDNRQIIKDAVASAKSGEKIQLQLFSPTAKGTPKWWDIIVLPVEGEGTDKNHPRILSVSRDITEQKLNELKEKELLGRFQTLVVEAPVAICVLRGKDYVIEVINKGMYEMWDRTLEQALNKPAFEVLPELMEQGFKQLLDNVYKTGERFVTDELPINLKRNGKLENVFVKFVYEPLRDADGTISGVMALAHEITEQVVLRKKIEESETKFRTLIEDAPVATCFFTGREMRIELANDKMLTYWGKEKNVIGQPLADAVPELVGQPFLQLLDDVFTTGKIYEAKNEVAQLEVNGVLGTYYFDYTYKPIRNAAGEIYGIMNMAVDVTGQVLAFKKIKESESHFRTMSDLMPQKVWTADMEGNYDYFNKCWFDYSGLGFDELKDWGWKKVIHPEDWEETKSRWQQSIITGENFEMEHRFRNTEGKYKWHLSRGLLQKDEYGISKIWIGTNTEMQQIKEEEQRKDDFVKMVSHELKTPVTSIKGYVQTLLMMLDDTEEIVPPEQIKPSLVRMDKQVLKLTRLISEMLDLSRIETGSLELKIELFSLNNLIDEIAGDILVSQPKYNIELYHDFTASLYADRDRIGQVLINFINNAIKYSPASNRIEIRIYKTGNDKVSVSVKDFGIGISKEEQEKIFERFYRVGGKNEQTFPGFGIGLFLASSIIQKHKGTISINSEKDKGSEFIFTLNASN